MSTDGRTRRAQEAREQRRGQILDAALAVFAEQGYHQTSVTDLVKAAGVARGTFYLYFDSKAAIFHELLDGLLTELGETIQGVDTREGAPPIPTQLEATLHRVLRALSDNEALCRILFREAVGLDEEVDRKLRAFYEHLRAYIQAALENGQRMGFIREMNTRTAALAGLGSVKEVVARTLVDGGGEEDLRAVAAELLAYNLRGVVVRG
ncbi:MAG: TetR/AcrR family transcriptional regulator [Deltaproteobacteria bacterium]|nr:MAG: TetR/AcrR family transcriptional regulator [Deltaproteobacteria bacterium]